MVRCWGGGLAVDAQEDREGKAGKAACLRGRGLRVIQVTLPVVLQTLPPAASTLLTPYFSPYPLPLPCRQCFGELNLEMEQHFASLPARAIRGYHSFTRMPRAMLLERYALSLQQQGHGHALQLWVEGQRQGAAGDGSALPLQVRQREGAGVGEERNKAEVREGLYY